MNAAGGFTYDPATLEEASRELSRGSASIEAQLSAMANKVSPLQQAFVGQAGQGFQQLWQEWHESGKRLKQSLEGLSQLLHGAATNAAQMEEANKRLMQHG